MTHMTHMTHTDDIFSPPVLLRVVLSGGRRRRGGRCFFRRVRWPWWEGDVVVFKTQFASSHFEPVEPVEKSKCPFVHHARV